MMRYKFQHFIDISTSASSLTMIKINAGGDYAARRMKHLWGAFKYVKMGRVSIKLLPASTLPVDPLGLSYENTDPITVDPRDQMNPGLVRITNGENILDDFTGLTDTQMEQMYINTMLDPRWSKFMLQSGFKRSAYPLYWNVGQLEQDVYPGAVVNVPNGASSSSDDVVGTTSLQLHDWTSSSTDVPNGTLSAAANRQNSDPRGLFQVGHRGRMGWMPTDAFYTYAHANDAAYVETEQPMIQPLPSINVITVLLPKAYKTVYYYRLFITEEYFLAGLKNTGVNDGTDHEYRAIDNFMAVTTPMPALPQNGIAGGGGSYGLPNIKNDGDSNH